MDNKDEPQVARVNFSSEHEGALYYDKDNNRIAVGLEEPEPYKPQYDMEIGGKSPYYPDETRYKFSIYFDIYKEIANYETRTKLLGYLKALRKVLLHKYIWRHFDKAGGSQ